MRISESSVSDSDSLEFEHNNVSKDKDKSKHFAYFEIELAFFETLLTLSILLVECINYSVSCLDFLKN